MQWNDYRQIQKMCNFKKMQRNIENIVRTTVEYLQMNQILLLNNP